MAATYWTARGLHPATERHAGPGTDQVVEPVRQVGRWFERVHLEALRTAVGVEVLAANEALRAQGRTLGELDVLYRHGTRVVHREVAVKYYLATRPGRDPSSWVGPGRRDRLDVKLERLATHQLALPALARSLGAWPQGLPYPDVSEVLLLGALFSPPEDPRLPEGARDDAEHGRWFFASDFARRFGDAPWAVLEKPWWLSPAHVERGDGVPARTLGQRLRGPRLVAPVDAPDARAFVVPDGWWE